MIQVVEQADVLTEPGWQAMVDDLLAYAKDTSDLTKVVLTVTRDPLTDEILPRPGNVWLFGVFAGETDDEIEESKESFHRLVTFVSIAGDAIACTLLTEAWVSVQPRGQTPVRPSQDPNRRERKLVVSNHRQFGQVAFFADVSGPEDARTVGAWEKTEGSHFESRFIALVPEHVAKHGSGGISAQTARSLARLAISSRSSDAWHTFTNHDRPRG